MRSFEHWAWDRHNRLILQQSTCSKPLIAVIIFPSGLGHVLERCRPMNGLRVDAHLKVGVAVWRSHYLVPRQAGRCRRRFTLGALAWDRVRCLGYWRQNVLGRLFLRGGRIRVDLDDGDVRRILVCRVAAVAIQLLFVLLRFRRRRLGLGAARRAVTRRRFHR